MAKRRKPPQRNRRPPRRGAPVARSLRSRARLHAAPRFASDAGGRDPRRRLSGRRRSVVVQRHSKRQSPPQRHRRPPRRGAPVARSLRSRARLHAVPRFASDAGGREPRRRLSGRRRSVVVQHHSKRQSPRSLRSRARLILASASPRRRVLLRKLGAPFRVVPSSVGEASRQKDPRRLVVELALRKARDVARRHPEALVLGADTIVVCRGRILGKPRHYQDSLSILRLLNGRWQDVYTGVAVVREGGLWARSRAVRSRVLARRLSEAQLRRLAGKHMDKAGAYAVQDQDDPFIERIVGDYGNVVGLPLEATRRLLSGAGLDLKPRRAFRPPRAG
ncbi:MAG: Maf family protein [Elusimicrobia bacterium]|nr:Maf family protein [Elusimicrobiota bacterium]